MGNKYSIVVCYTENYSIVLHCTYSTVLHCTYSTGLHCTYSTVLHCTYSTVLHCTYSTVLHCTKTVLYCTVLKQYCTALYLQYCTARPFLLRPNIIAYRVSSALPSPRHELLSTPCYSTVSPSCLDTNW